jgi:hypothetical protein
MENKQLDRDGRIEHVLKNHASAGMPMTRDQAALMVDAEEVKLTTRVVCSEKHEAGKEFIVVFKADGPNSTTALGSAEPERDIRMRVDADTFRRTLVGVKYTFSLAFVSF